jgi:hypothetical protein
MYRILEYNSNLVFLKDYLKHKIGDKIIGETWLDIERNQKVYKIDDYILVGSDMVLDITDFRDKLINELL